MAKTLLLLAVTVLLPLAVLSWMWALMLDYYSVPVQYDGPSHPNGEVAPFPGGTSDNLWWFIHISDIHVSRFRDPSRTTDFQRFCRENIDVIQPEVVLVTGDLTDAKTKDHIGSAQQEIEWQSYRSAIRLAQADEKTVWIDVRGNHDAFDIPHLEHKYNYYRKYSIYGPEGDHGSFIYEHKLPFGTYSFVSLYAVLDPGPKRPFNFFGVLTEGEAGKLEANVAKAAKSNHTIIFGHYPTSTVVAPKPGLSGIMGKCTAYLCGHLHSLGGMAPNLKALQRSGSLELEVEDWKDNRMYRVMAIDHDILSFADVKFGQWPVILITNPKRARFMAPKHEPIQKMQYSTHIRILLFSPFPITTASVFLDGAYEGSAQQVEGSLYAIPWNPQDYRGGLHYIAVTATDANDNTQTVRYQFSVDGSRPEQWLFPAVILLSDMRIVFLLLYAVLFCVVVLPLPVVRWWFRRGSHAFNRSAIVRGIILLSHNDLCYYTLMITSTYPAIGPWCVGALIGGYYGVSTMHGIYVNGAFVGEVFSYAVVLLDMLFLHLPVTAFLVLKLGLQETTPTQNGSVKTSKKLCSSSLLFSSLQFLIYAGLFFPVAWAYYSLKTLWYGYGPMAFFISPKTLWTHLLLLYVFYRVHFPGPRGVTANGTHSSDDIHGKSVDHGINGVCNSDAVCHVAE